MTKEAKKVEEMKETLEVKQDNTTSEVLKEVLALKKELETLKKERLRFSDAEKEAIERARDEMLTDDEIGALYIDEKHKEEGFSYRIVDSTRPGRIAKMMKIGYAIVEDPDMQVGQSVVGKSSNLGAAVTVELGIHRGSCLGVLMRIPKEKYDARQKAKARRVRETEAATMQDMVDKSDFGTITIGNSTYKK